MSYGLGRRLAARWPHLSLWAGALVMILASAGLIHWYGSRASWYLVPVCILVGAICSLVRRPLGDWLFVLGLGAPMLVGMWQNSPIPLAVGLLYSGGFLIGVGVQRSPRKSG